jgi:hypothetical protein
MIMTVYDKRARNPSPMVGLFVNLYVGLEDIPTVHLHSESEVRTIRYLESLVSLLQYFFVFSTTL